MTTQSYNLQWFVLALITAVAAVVAIPALNIYAQSTAPLARTPGRPAGTYPLSDLDHVNLFAGNMSFSLPLLTVQGRGESRHVLSLTLETQWDATYADNAGFSVYGLNAHTQVPVGFIGWMRSETTAQSQAESCVTGSVLWVDHRFNFTFIEADGTEHMLGDPTYHGRPFQRCGSATINYGRVFQSTAGQFMTFVSDQDVWSFGSATGYLHFKNGSKARIEADRIMWVQDRNGNRVSYEYESSNPFNYPLVKKVTDSIGRQVNIYYNVVEASPYGLCDKIVYKGFEAEDRIIRISKDSLHNALRTTQPSDSSTVKNIGQLFPDEPNDMVIISNPTAAYDPENVIKAVWLPNGQSYQFYYNVYGRLARVVVPTGGATEYDYEPSLLQGPGSPAAYVVNRLKEKRTYANGTTLSAKTSFAYALTTDGFPQGSSGLVATVEQFDHLENRLTKTRHFFNGGPNGDWGYVVPWWNGREIKTESFAMDGSTVLRRVEMDWRQRTPSWCYNNPHLVNPCGGDPPNTAPTTNPFVLETKTTLVDANLVSKVSALKPDGSYGFDDYNNQTDLYE
ncbi:MAG TPA: hypothetical protein VFS76_16545 [Pyrinomonadaceae bacterium]|nr:hypothetical protein [Pyrinomonadaceae bacterium]